jgi:hypothetical protein
MIRRIREKFETVRCKKRHKFDDFGPLIERCFRQYSHLFPNRKIKKEGSKVVYHPNCGDLDPISLEREHGSREYLPHRYAKFAIAGVDDLISYIETHPDAGGGREDVENPDEQRQEPTTLEEDLDDTPK